MADIKISDMSSASALTGIELVEVVQGGSNKQTTAQAIADLALKTVKVSCSSAEILAMGVTPKTLIAAPGAGKMIKVLGWTLKLNYGTVAYATNTNLRARLGASGADGILNATSYLSQTANEITVYNPASPINTASDFTLVTNQALVAYVQTGNPTAGDSTLDIYVNYVVITL